MNEQEVREYLRANLFDGSEGGVFTATTSIWLNELASVVTDLPAVRLDEKDIRWLAELVSAQALSERHSVVREYVGYNDRDWMQSKVAAVDAKIARCKRILDILNQED